MELLVTIRRERGEDDNIDEQCCDDANACANDSAGDRKL